eukprot:7379851-Prymnesium_polylepis.6
MVVAPTIGSRISVCVFQLYRVSSSQRRGRAVGSVQVVSRGKCGSLGQLSSGLNQAAWATDAGARGASRGGISHESRRSLSHGPMQLSGCAKMRLCGVLAGGGRVVYVYSVGSPNSWLQTPYLTATPIRSLSSQDSHHQRHLYFYSRAVIPKRRGVTVLGI